MEKILKKIGDICSIVTKGTTPTTLGFDYAKDGINFIKIESITDNGMFIPSKFEHISEECNDKLKRSQLQKNDILFSIAGALGRTAIVNENMLPANTNQAIAIIRLNDKSVLHEYIEILLRSDPIKKQINNMKRGVAQLNLSLQNISDLVVPIPSLEEQRKIIAKIKTISTLKHQNQALLQHYDDLVKSQFIEMFGDVYSLQNEAKHTIGDYVSDRTIKVSKLENQQKIKYIDISSINNQTNEITSYTEYEVNNRPSRAQQVVEKGDILISTVRPNLNNVAMVTDSFDNLVASTGFCVIKKNENVNEYFIFALVKNIEFANYLTKLTTGANYPAVNNKSILDFKLDIPPIELQNQFADFVKHIDKLKFRETITKLKNLCYNIFNIIQSKSLSEVKK